MAPPGGTERGPGALLASTLVWDNHACMPLRPGDHAFLGELERVRAAGIDVIALNVGFGPQPLEAHLRMLADFRAWLGRHPERYALVRTTGDIDRARAEGRLAVFFDIEGMGPLDEGDHGLVELLRRLGVGWMLIAYNRNNAAGGGCLDDDRGLTPHGRQVLAEMRRVGMIACCSHTGHRTAMDVFEAAENPVIFSHSNAAAVHGHPRNIPDALIRACAETGGVVGINGVGDFLGRGEDYAAMIAQHVDHVVQLVGPEHAGLSLDYVFDRQEIVDYLEQMAGTFGEGEAAQFTNRFAPPETFAGVVAQLQGRGYADGDVAKILGGNWYRVAREVWRATPA